MFSRITLENFRCHRSVSIDLGDLTILVGANATGKSSVLSALDPRGRIHAPDVRGRAASDAEVILHGPDDRQPFRKTLRSNGGFHSNGPRYSYQFLRLQLAQLREPNQVQEEVYLKPDGGNLANVIGTLTRNEQGELARRFCATVPMYGDIHVRPKASGHHRIVFQDRWHEDVWYEPTQVSDGTMLMLALLVLPLQNPPVDIVAIEEPERGLHPYLIETVVTMARNMAEGKLGRKAVQVVMATHSPALLEFARPEEVRFFERDPKSGEVSVTSAPTGTDEWERAFAAFSQSLGSAWLSGALGGTPT